MFSSDTSQILSHNIPPKSCFVLMIFGLITIIIFIVWGVTDKIERQYLTVDEIIEKRQDCYDKGLCAHHEKTMDNKIFKITCGDYSFFDLTDHCIPFNQ